jgi:small subunit ribosomal protein S6e
MAEFKLVIGDSKTGKCHQIVVTDDNAKPFIGKKIGDKIKGESFDFSGYEFEITGGADYCGFPMRRDVEGPVRKKILLTSGVGIRNKEKGIRKRKIVCGNTIHERITQISMKILKYGKKPLAEEEPAEEAEEKPQEESKPEQKPEAKEEKPEKEVQPKVEKKKEQQKEEKVEKKPKVEKKEKPKEEKFLKKEKKEVKVVEKKQDKKEKSEEKK